MNDSEFLDQAEQLLRHLEMRCDQINDATDADIDNQRVGGMVTLTFPNRSQLIVNLQKPLHEVWLAARSGGYHYRLIEGKWLDTKGQGEFWAQLEQDASAQSGQSIRFNS